MSTQPNLFPITSASLFQTACSAFGIGTSPRNSHEAKMLARCEIFARETLDDDDEGPFLLEEVANLSVALLLYCGRVCPGVEHYELDFARAVEVVGCAQTARLAFLRNGVFPRERKGQLVYSSVSLGASTPAGRVSFASGVKWDGVRLHERSR